jgi:hypothetical protein
MTLQMRLCPHNFNPCIAPLLQESKLGNVFSKPFFSISRISTQQGWPRPEVLASGTIAAKIPPPAFLLHQKTPRSMHNTLFWHFSSETSRIWAVELSIGPLRSSGLGPVNYPFPVFKFEHTINMYMGDSLPQSSFNTVFASRINLFTTTLSLFFHHSGRGFRPEICRQSGNVTG